MKATLHYNTLTFDFEFDPSDYELLQYQVFSLTNLDPEHQILTLKSNNNTNTVLSMENMHILAGLSEQCVIQLMDKKDQKVQTQPVQRSQPYSYPMPVTIDWQTSCTKIYLGEQPATQPCFYVNNGDYPVCAACAMTCYNQDAISPSYVDIMNYYEHRFNSTPIMCQCSQHIECLYMVRSALGEEVLPAPQIAQLCRVMENASIRSLL